jgi:hypothetical protein
MSYDYDPITQVTDELLTVDEAMLDGLQAFRNGPKLAGLYGPDRERLMKALNELSDVLLREIGANPRKAWVMVHFQKVLKLAPPDAETCRHYGKELVRLMDIMRIQSSDGLLNYYLSPASAG